MKVSEKEIRDLIREQIVDILQEKNDVDVIPGVGEVISNDSLQRFLDQIGLDLGDVERVEAGSTIGIGAPGGYNVYLNRTFLGKPTLKKLADSHVQSIGVDRNSGKFKIHFK